MPRGSWRASPRRSASATTSCIPPKKTPEWILKQADLPANVAPGDSKLKDPEARAPIARVFERGLEAPAGCILPLQRMWQAKDQRRLRWRSKLWRTRRGPLYLVPGDSPVGFRLPLGALPHIGATDYPYVYPADPATAEGALPDVHADRAETRRALMEELEICIDKLYSPEGPAGRLGLVGFRGFEMPPRSPHEPRPAPPATRHHRARLGRSGEQHAGALGPPTSTPPPPKPSPRATASARISPT